MGFSEFYYLRFFIDQNVLIPRPETEFMVDLIRQEANKPFSKILDVGVGSGAILLSLIRHGVAKKGVGVDLSFDALKVAQINATRLCVESKVELIKFIGII